MSDLFPDKKTNENKIVDFLKRKGFLMAIVLCLSTVAIVGYISVRNVVDVPSPSDWKISAEQNTDDIKSSIAPVIVPKEDVKSTPQQSSSKSTSSEVKKEPPKEIIKYSLPIKGNIVKNFSTEVPVFSKTLNDYRAHTGIDIEAKDGDTVLSSAPGKITKAISDELMGYTVEITDTDGIISCYSGLKDLSFVKEGNEVKKGDIIGKVGNPPNFEQLDGTHLHFQMIKDGVYLNPIDMVK